MAINKVVIKEDGNTRTLIDITDSTVNPETLADGVVAYDKKGEKIAGTLKAEDFYNFDVVGNPQPANPKENTIWVDTDTPITSWVFSATEPAPSDVMALSFWDGYPWYLLAPQSLSAGDVLSFEIPEGVPSFYELVNISDPTTGDMYFVRNSDGSACNAWVKGTKVSVVLSNDTNEINGYGSDAKTAYIRSYGSYGMTEGNVWFPVDTSSAVEFNALKKNGVMVYPITAKQYINGAWTNKEAKIYQGGSWVNLWDGYLYKDGNEYTDVTGGWISASKNIGSWGNGAGTPVMEKTSTHIKMHSEGNGTGSMFYTKNKIDLKNFSTIKFEGYSETAWQASGYHHFRIWSDIGTYHESNAVVTYTIYHNGQLDFSVDVSNLTGQYHIGFGAYTTCPIYMYKLWAE